MKLYFDFVPAIRNLIIQSFLQNATHIDLSRYSNSFISVSQSSFDFFNQSLHRNSFISRVPNKRTMFFNPCVRFVTVRKLKKMVLYIEFVHYSNLYFSATAKSKSSNDISIWKLKLSEKHWMKKHELFRCFRTMIIENFQKKLLLFFLEIKTHPHNTHNHRLYFFLSRCQSKTW